MKIVEINNSTILISVLKIEPDASYNLEEVRIKDDTIIDGFGLKSLLVNEPHDLKKGQKIRIWFTGSDQKIAEKVIVYNLFEGR